MYWITQRLDGSFACSFLAGPRHVRFDAATAPEAARLLAGSVRSVAGREISPGEIQWLAEVPAGDGGMTTYVNMAAPPEVAPRSSGCGNCDHCIAGLPCQYHGPWCGCPWCKGAVAAEGRATGPARRGGWRAWAGALLARAAGRI